MTRLERNTTYNAIICLNGDLPLAERFDAWANVPLIAADGAANALVGMGIVPEYVVGDLDSILEETMDIIAEVATVIAMPDQDVNDFEKALTAAQHQLFERVLVVGMHGGDLEHTLNNWSVLMRFGRSMNVHVLDRQRLAIPVYGPVKFSATSNEIISLVPQPSVRLTTSGLQWPLTNETLELGQREGARNRATSSEVTLDVHDGAVLVVLDA
jgi:thiamine pyrophosphokinase